MRTFLLTAFLLVPTASFAASFSDVPDSHPNADAIAYVKAEGIVEGYANGTFKADAMINRAEFTKIVIGALWNEEDLPKCLRGEGVFERVPTSPSMDFSDVEYATAWYRDYLCVARSMAIIDGYPDGTFRPGASINFAEAAKIMVNGFGLAYNEKHDPDIAVRYPWYQPYIEDLSEKNAIPVSITGLDQAITRGEMAEMIYRLKTGNSDGASRTYEMLELRTETVTKGDVSFEITYPGWWGVLQHEDQDEEQGFYAWTFDALYSTPYSAYVIVTPKGEGMQFYSKPCGEGCEYDQTFDQARARFASNRTSAGGMRIDQDDSYSAESGSFGRGGSFFTENAYVSVGGWTGLRFYDEEYYRRYDRGESPSLTEVIVDDIGESDDPINAAFAKHPQETVAEQRFFAQVDAMIGSVR